MKRSSGSIRPKLRSSKTKIKRNKAECSKKKEPDEVSEPKTNPQNQTSLLNILKNDQDCNCEVVARAVRSNIHSNISWFRGKKSKTD